jgi:peptidyl-prolyl cis-trans isomerase A (cyclophilin A)
MISKISSLSVTLFAASFFIVSGCDKKTTVPSETQVPPVTQEQTPMANNAPSSLLNPRNATEKAPEVYKVKFATTKGDFILEVHRSWAPYGADRFYNLVKLGFYNDVVFFRVIDGFMAQFGIHGDPAVAAVWRDANIPDDPPSGQSNIRGMASFATAGPNTRTTQIFLNFGNNSPLDSSGFTPFGKIIEGESILDQLYRGYGEGAPMGNGPDQGRIQRQGNAYLKSSFPNLDAIKTAQLIN